MLKSVVCLSLLIFRWAGRKRQLSWMIHPQIAKSIPRDQHLTLLWVIFFFFLICELPLCSVSLEQRHFLYGQIWIFVLSRVNLNSCSYHVNSLPGSSAKASSHLILTCNRFTFNLMGACPRLCLMPRNDGNEKAYIEIRLHPTKTSYCIK